MVATTPAFPASARREKPFAATRLRWCSAALIERMSLDQVAPEHANATVALRSRRPQQVRSHLSIRGATGLACESDPTRVDHKPQAIINLLFYIAFVSRDQRDKSSQETAAGLHLTLKRLILRRFFAARKAAGNYRVRSRMITTRRLRARPAAVALLAIGCSAPSPTALMREAVTPCAISAFCTASARCCESSRLVCG